MKLSDFYQYDKRKIDEIVKELRPRSVLIQLPEGLKHFFPSLLRELREIIPKDARVVVDGSSIWGSCLMDVGIVSSYDLVLHFGHIQYPYWSPPPNVVLIDLKSKKNVSRKSLDKLVEYLRSKSLYRIGLYGTAQHEIKPLASYLSSKGVEVLNDIYLSTILGCWYSDLERIKNRVDAVVVVSGGVFHSVGAGLLLNGQKTIITLDPYRDSFRDLTPKVIKLLKTRYYKVLRASEKQGWVIITGGAGQYRPHIVKHLEELLNKEGKRYYEVRVTYLSSETLGNIDNKEVDVFVITSCPRLPIDDFANYPKPVLTPGEAKMALTSPARRYIFPW